MVVLKANIKWEDWVVKSPRECLPYSSDYKMYYDKFVTLCNDNKIRFNFSTIVNPCFEPNKRMIYTLNMTSQKNVLAGFHELGHALVGKNDPYLLTLYQLRGMQPYDYTTYEVIEEELIASNYALSEVPDVGDKHILLYCLNTYVKYSDISKWPKKTKRDYIQFCLDVGRK